MTDAPDVSVLIPVLDEEAHIRDTVAAMQAQELDGRTAEFLFIDGRSRDRTREVLEALAREDARIVVLDNPRRTTACGLNVGLRHARGRYVARMDAHSFFPPRYLAAGVDRLGRGDVDWVAGPVVPRGTGTWSRRVALALRGRLGVGGSRKWDGLSGTHGETELDTGVFCGVWERATLEAYGGWDAGWPVNQDSELAARVLAAGGRIVNLPEMAAEYLPRDDLRALFRQYWRHGFYRAKTSRRHAGTLRRTHVLPPATVLVLVAALLAPRPLRRLARPGALVYAGALASAGAAAGRRASAQDAAALPVVLATMHVGWGLGFMWGWVRFAAARP